jgi:hypothetical protein
MLAEEVTPAEWKLVVCHCSKEWNGRFVGYPARWFSGPPLKLFTCKSCEKPCAIHLHKCVNCSDVFLKDFSHPGWIFDWPRCWKCLEGLSARDLRAAQITTRTKQPLIFPTLRFRYLHITEPGRIRTRRLVLE